MAFSISIHVDGDVLLLDEVLAVGDSGFQDKCNEAFRRLKKEGKTIVLVTHSMDAVRRFCDRAMLMEEGRMVEIGDPDDDRGALPGHRRHRAWPRPPGPTRRAVTAMAPRTSERSGWRARTAGPIRVFKQGGHLTIRAEVAFKQAMEEPKFALRDQSGGRPQRLQRQRRNADEVSGSSVRSPRPCLVSFGSRTSWGWARTRSPLRRPR